MAPVPRLIPALATAAAVAGTFGVAGAAAMVMPVPADVGLAPAPRHQAAAAQAEGAPGAVVPAAGPQGVSLKQEPLLFAGVYTAPTDEARQRRQEIRATYWTHWLLQPGGPVEAKFVVGWTEKTDPNALALQEEARLQPDDFLVLDVRESYNNLTMKTMMFLRWFVLHGRAAYVLKMDDDTFPHFDPIVTQLRQEANDYSHFGLLFSCAPVLKETKWAENPQVWNHSFFPRYMQGSGYFLSSSLVHELAGRSYERNSRKMLNNEDAAVGVWIDLMRKENPKVHVEQRAIGATLTGCQPDDLLSMNNQIGYMNCYWRRFLRGEKDICCYGPLNNLRQSLLQLGSRTRTSARFMATARAMARARAAAALGCYEGE